MSSKSRAVHQSCQDIPQGRFDRIFKCSGCFWNGQCSYQNKGAVPEKCEFRGGVRKEQK